MKENRLEHYKMLYETYLNKRDPLSGYILVKRLTEDKIEELEEKESQKLSDPISSKAELLEDIPDENFIDLFKFWDIYRICPSSISHYLRKDQEFFDWCAKKGPQYRDKYYIQPIKALRYLEKFSTGKMKNKVRKIMYPDQFKLLG